MAKSPAHRFGQIIGNLLEEIIGPALERYCEERNLYLDKQGTRGTARTGKKVTWQDRFGNNHDLDFVIEKDGTAQKKGRPIAFIEAAWRRYTKHSKNKAQEIQGAILPIAELYNCEKPFLGAVIAGEFTEPSIIQLKSVGFEVLHFPYNTIVSAFAKIGINAQFEENTPEQDFVNCIDTIEKLQESEWEEVKHHLIQKNSEQIDHFFNMLGETLDRLIDRIIIYPLYGSGHDFLSIDNAMNFITSYQENNIDLTFRKFEVVVNFSNGDNISGTFENQKRAIDFLKRIAS